MVRLFRLLALLPLSLMQRAGAALGWLVWLASPRYRLRLESQARAAGFTPDQYRPAVAAMGTMVAELPWLWMRGPHESVLPHVGWDHAEVFEAALAQGRGVIVAAPHLGCWEIVAQAMGERFGTAQDPMVALFRPPRKTWLAPLVARSRDRAGLRMVPTNLSGVRTLLRVLRQGGAIGILPDQVPPLGQGVWAPFFGRPAYTMTLIGRLAQQSGAPVIMVWCARVRATPRYRIRFERLDAPALYDAQSTPEEATAALNAGMEALIRQNPGQYLWSYARYKQPAGDE